MRFPGFIAMACLLGLSLALAQQPPAADGSRTKTRVDDRLRALRQEADRLANQSKTLLGEVRKLEVQRDIRVAESQQAESALSASKEDLNDATRRLELLEEQRLRGLPDLKQQLVETYKRGRSGYLRLLLSAGDLRGFARATRAMTALTFRQERVLNDYHLTVDALRAERGVLETKMAELKTRDANARRARGLAEKAVADRAALINDGAIVAEGTFDELARSQEPFVTQFLGKDR